MKARFAAVLAAAIAVSAPAIAQNMEPGEWEITSITHSSDTPKPEIDTEKKCVTKEEIEDVNQWVGDMPGCKITQAKKTASNYTWQVSCPQSRGSGTMRWTRTTVDMDIIFVATEKSGAKTEIRTKISGKRLGACKN